MAFYSNLMIKLIRKFLRPLMAPKRSVILFCFIVIIFVNFLTCHLTPVEVSSPSPLLRDHHRSEVQALSRNASTTIRIENQNQTEPVQATLAPRVLIAHSLSLSSSNESNSKESTGDTSSNIRYNDTQIKVLDERVGQLAPSRHPSTKNAIDSEPMSPPSISESVTTTTSFSNDYDQEQDLKQIYLESSTPSTVDEMKSTTSQPEVNQPNVESPNRLTETDDPLSVQDLVALETSSLSTSNMTQEEPLNRLEQQNEKTRPSTLPSERANFIRPRVDASGDLNIQVAENGARLPDSSVASQLPTQNSLIPNASLLDLLHIIKHLNLMNNRTEHESQFSANALDRSSQLTNDYKPSHLHPLINEAPRIYKTGVDPTSRDQNVESLQGSLNRRQLNSNQLISSPGAIQSLNFVYPSLDELMTSLESAAPSKVGDRHAQQTKSSMIGDRPTRGTSESTISDSTKRSSRFESALDSRKQSRYSLVSPYSANFDSGLESLVKSMPSNRASVPTFKDQLRPNNGAHGAENRPPLFETNEMQKLKIGSKLPPEMSPPTNTKQESMKNSSQVLYYSVNEEDTSTKLARKTPKPQKSTQDQRRKAIGSNRYKTAESLPNHDSSSKRGERDILDPNHKSMSSGKTQTYSTNDQDGKDREMVLDKVKPDDNGQSENEIHRQQQPAVSHFGLASRKMKKKEPPYQLMEGPMASVMSSRPILYPIKSENVAEGNLGEANSQQVPTTATSYLDDPHKKSYYWTSEQAGLYLDNLNNMSLQLKPLTIGELARQHGINALGLQPMQAPFMENLHHNYHNQGHLRPYSMMENFGLSSESGLDESYASFPQNHQPDSLTISKILPNFNDNFNKETVNNQFKVDDELKKKIAIKAVEAATRDPELSAALFGSLMNLNSNSEAIVSKTNSISNQIEPIHHHFDQHSSGLSNQNINHVTQYAGDLSSETFSNWNQVLRPRQVPHITPSLMSGANNHLNSLSMMVPVATMQDSHLANSLGPISNSTTAQPVNLVITDLANKWALSRMPDLVPIPLAATVPGYLIRLPNGKILAAALTNMFSIQGIQRGPLTNNYKNLINSKFKGLIKQPNGHYGNIGSDSAMRPTVVLPAGHYPLGIVPATPKGASKTKTLQPNREKVTSLFSRGVLSQLGLAGFKSYQRDQNRLSKYPSGKTKTNLKPTGQKNPNAPRTVNKLTAFPFPVSAFTDQDLAHLPIASPNEPVFSFADESQLIDQLDLHQAIPSTLPRIKETNTIPGPNQIEQQPDLHSTLIVNPMTNGNGPNLFDLRDKLSHIIDSSRSIAHLGAFSGLGGEEFLSYNSKKRKSPSRFPLRLESIYNWLASKRAKILRKDSKSCADKI